MKPKKIKGHMANEGSHSEFNCHWRDIYRGTCSCGPIPSCLQPLQIAGQQEKGHQTAFSPWDVYAPVQLTSRYPFTSSDST